MHPILFTLFGFEVPSYGVALVASFLVSAWLLRREAGRMKLDPEKMTDAAVTGLLWGLIGAKLLLVVVEFPDFLDNPKGFWTLLRSAGVIYGGQIGGALGVIWFIRRHRLQFWTTLDTMVPFLALGIGLGRISCLLAGCCYGAHWDGPLALHFPDHPQCSAPADIGLFPVQPFAILNGIVLFLILRTILRHRQFHGQVLASFLGLYGLTRGLLEFARGDSVRGIWLGGTVSTSQLIALCGIVLAVALYQFQRRKPFTAEAPAGNATTEKASPRLAEKKNG
ncbi:Prolipoprotein diacylglyceryl transferase [Sulfidibacter corallicola]|uniref:Prolipoprotein diacylglyceryl transferase n=1 Tax=Sulfidibacter corallicola TaxID=2818388 RepID=A0A8A4TUH3_SULCO|nr:prolipoprotein diacylglyceryl transferase [Sulfidibacter corallicola]QTD52761.1 prolipoprotein diacylglyceryl transferase [Sulfidibacter corallicola]